MKKKMSIILAMMMFGTTLCTTSVAAEDFAVEMDTEVIEMEENSDGMADDIGVAEIETFDADSGVEAAMLDETEAEEQPEEGEEDVLTDGLPILFDDGGTDAGEGNTIDIKLGETVTVDPGNNMSAKKEFVFTPEVSGFYQFDYPNLNISTITVEDKIALADYNIPYLIKDKNYSFDVTAFSGRGIGSICIKLVREDDGKYEKFISVGMSKQQNIIWTLNDNTLNINGNGEIPNISWKGLSGIKLHKIVIGEGITEIISGVFSHNFYLQEVDLPASLEVIGSRAFYYSSNLETVKLPVDSKLKKVGYDAFTNTAFLNNQFDDFIMLNNIIIKYKGQDKNITLPETAVAVGDKSISKCDSLESVSVPANVTSIGYAAFVSDTALENAVLDEGVQEIANDAFLDCPKMKQITIPKSVTYIGKHAVGYSKYDRSGAYGVYSSDTAIEDAVLASGALNDNCIKYSEEERPTINCWYNTVGYQYAIDEEMPYNLLDAKDLANKKLCHVNAEQSVTAEGAKITSIEVRFADKKLTEGTDYKWNYTTTNGKHKLIVMGVGDYYGTYETTVDALAYKQQESFQDPSTETEQKVSTLKKGTSFRVGTDKYKVTGRNTVAYTGSKNKNAKKISVRNTVAYKGVTYKITSVYAKAFRNHKKVTQISIGNNVVSIGTSAFEGCKALKRVVIGTQATTIGKNAFKNCKKISNITIKSKKVRSVKENAFKGISIKAKIRVPASRLKIYKKLLKNKGQSSKVKIIK